MRRTVALGLSALLLAAACAPQPAPTGQVTVVASTYPLYEFARRIGGDAVTVRPLVPPGASAHEYEPTPADVAALQAAHVLIYNGAGLEPWVDRLVIDLPERVILVNTTAGLPLAEADHPLDDQDHVGEAEDADDPEDNASVYGKLDPHVWLDPLLAREQAAAVLAGLIRTAPEHRAIFEANAAALFADLDALHDRYRQTLAACARRDFITAHAAFGYLARRYGLRMIPIGGLSPEVEPSPRELLEVIREARAHGATVIYYETLVSPRVAEVIAREVGARTLVLNPLEGLTPKEQRAGRTYFTVMDENLRHLADGLDCR